VRGVKARRHEAGQRLEELAQNLLRLEDLRSEIEPRLDVVRAQAAAAREVAEANGRLEVLRGSIVWDEWREVRDAHRRSSSQIQGLERRLAEAREQAATAETEFQTWRGEVQAAQDRRLARQGTLGRLRLELSAAEHALQLAEQRAESSRALADAVSREAADHRTRAAAAEALRGQLTAEIEQARLTLESVPDALPQPAAPDPVAVQKTRQAAELARRALAGATSTVAAHRTRREFLEDQVSKMKVMSEAAAHIPGAEAALARERAIASDAAAAAAEAARLRSELEGLDALRPSPAGGLARLGDVLTPEPGYEAALSAALGPLVDALVSPDEEGALKAAEVTEPQRTVLYPVSAPHAEAGSLLEHVFYRKGYELVASHVLGGIVVGRDVTVEGVYREDEIGRAHV
jgi:chromosome segregation protein